MTKIKRIAAVHDLCGYGKCSLGIAIPVLSSFGHEVCPVPTGVFSMHTAMENWTMLDTTDTLDDYVRAWNKQDIKVDAVYSGFLTNKKQVSAIKQLYLDNSRALRFVDPVMGDNGILYKTYTEELVEAMKSLISGADIITPNVTEAQILTNSKEDLLEKLYKLGAKNIILTGVEEGNDICNYTYDGNKKSKFSYKLYNEQIHGTGDLFASLVLGMYMLGYSLNDSADYASKFTLDAVELTKTQLDYCLRGVSFEPLLGKNTAISSDTAKAKTVGKICQP